MLTRLLPLSFIVLLSFPLFGQKPGPDDLVKLRYTIWKGEKVVEKIDAGKAAVMVLGRMMPGWKAAVETMSPGDKRRVTVTSSESGGKLPAGTVYEIDTELVAVIPGPKTPEHLTVPPPEATRTRSGLSWVQLKPGTGVARPGRRSKVVVNYHGWTTEGRLFDSTALRGKPSEFRLDSVIAGWTEGMQMMTAGEIRRFWVPAKLAYEKQDGPQGMLIFDIELLEVK